MTDVLLRPAEGGDADAVADVYLAARRAFLPYAPLAHTEDDVRRWVANILVPSNTVTIAVQDGNIVGMMTLSSQDGIGWIEHFYLLPGVTGQGVGTQMLTAAKATLGPPVRLYTFQANGGARRFYERHGFVAITFRDGADNEERCPDVLYEWA